MSTTQLLSLVEYIAYKVGCEYISDLHTLDEVKKRKAFRAVEKVPMLP